MTATAIGTAIGSGSVTGPPSSYDDLQRRGGDGSLLSMLPKAWTTSEPGPSPVTDSESDSVTVTESEIEGIGEKRSVDRGG